MNCILLFYVNFLWDNPSCCNSKKPKDTICTGVRRNMIGVESKVKKREKVGFAMERKNIENEKVLAKLEEKGEESDR